VINGAVGENVAIKYWITDDGNEEPPTAAAAARAAAGRAAMPRAAPPARQHDADEVSRPGEIKFADNTPAIEKDMVNTTATFSLPGEYIIRIEGNDSSGVGGGGFQCCWTTAYIKVNVKAAVPAASNVDDQTPRFTMPRFTNRGSRLCHCVLIHFSVSQLRRNSLTGLFHNAKFIGAFGERDASPGGRRPRIVYLNWGKTDGA
jgi:hypothetical protein